MPFSTAPVSTAFPPSLMLDYYVGVAARLRNASAVTDIIFAMMFEDDDRYHRDLQAIDGLVWG